MFYSDDEIEDQADSNDGLTSGSNVGSSGGSFEEVGVSLASPAGPNRKSAEDEDELEDPRHESATLALDVVIFYNQAKRSKTGAGAPTKKSAPERVIVEIFRLDSFGAFKQRVCIELQRFAKQRGYDVGTVVYKDIRMNAKIPKGQSKWKIPMAVDSSVRFSLFQDDLLASPDRLGIAKIELQELASNEPEEIAAPVASTSAKKASKRKAHPSTPPQPTMTKKAKKLVEDEKQQADIYLKKAEAIEEIERENPCKRGTCSNNRGACIEDNSGHHYPLTMEIKSRWAAAIVYDAASAKECPSTLVTYVYKNADRLRAQNRAPEPATPRRASPRRSSSSRSDVTILLATPNRSSSLNRKRNSGIDKKTASPVPPKLKQSLALPLQHGPFMHISAAAQRLGSPQSTTRTLEEAGFTRMGQLAIAYQNNFELFAMQTKLTAGTLADIEELLAYWAQAKTAEHSETQRTPTHAQPATDLGRTGSIGAAAPTHQPLNNPQAYQPQPLQAQPAPSFQHSATTPGRGWISQSPQSTSRLAPHSYNQSSQSYNYPHPQEIQAHASSYQTQYPAYTNVSALNQAQVLPYQQKNLSQQAALSPSSVPQGAGEPKHSGKSAAFTTDWRPKLPPLQELGRRSHFSPLQECRPFSPYDNIGGSSDASFQRDHQSQLHSEYRSASHPHQPLPDASFQRDDQSQPYDGYESAPHPHQPLKHDYNQLDYTQQPEGGSQFYNDYE
ncbi:hypothetical protein CF319_g2019 [Tilletia indica]|nr:hypothetical protein CF319_g2019 [Tilletia indica]